MTPREIANMINAMDAKRQRVGFEQLNGAERVVTLISYARFEITNGGMDQFYHNRGGDYAMETVWAFEQIGAPIAADVIRRANALFSNAQPSRDWLVRQDEWERLIGTSSDMFDALTDAYHRVDSQVDEQLAQFIVAHQLELNDIQSRPVRSIGEK